MCLGTVKLESEENKVKTLAMIVLLFLAGCGRTESATDRRLQEKGRLAIAESNDLYECNKDFAAVQDAMSRNAMIRQCMNNKGQWLYTEAEEAEQRRAMAK
jgi:hypothetical protein